MPPGNYRPDFHSSVRPAKSNPTFGLVSLQEQFSDSHSLNEIDIVSLCSYYYLLYYSSFIFQFAVSLQPIMNAASLYPLPTKEELVKEFVGKSIKDVATPAAVLDLGKVKNNCNRMLEACATLGFGWRAHIKTHKVGLNRP